MGLPCRTMVCVLSYHWWLPPLSLAGPWEYYTDTSLLIRCPQSTKFMFAPPLNIIKYTDCRVKKGYLRGVRCIISIVVVFLPRPKSIEWFTENQAFSPSYDLAPLPLPQPLSQQWARPVTHRKERQLADRRGGRGWGRSQIIWRRESLALYKSFNTLWLWRSPSSSLLVLVLKCSSWLMNRT